MSLVKSIREIQQKGLFPVISEIKLKSKKMGDLIGERDPIAIAREMESCPISGISVVTESRYFGGSMDLLKRVVNTVSVPVLHKDFIEDEEQIKESSRIGASAILLISSILAKRDLERLIDAGNRYGIEILLEVHTRDEIERIKGMDFDLLGINNRDIRILETDDTGAELTARLIRHCPKERPIISESGINSVNDLIRIKNSGVDAILIGTAVMLSDNIKGFLNQLIYVGWK